MEKFFECVFKESREIGDILSRNVHMTPLSRNEQDEFARATRSGNCNCDFTANNPKTRHHSHVTGRYLFPACNRCNLALKPRRSRFRYNVTNDGDAGGKYLVPIVFHNMSAYDSHFVLRYFRKEYAKYTTHHGKTAYADVGVIPLNGERNLLLKIGNVVFIDSCQFLATSLDELVKSMRKSGLQGDFVHTTRHFGRNELFLKKGIYPYEHMTDATKFDETELPAKSAFYNRLRDEHVSEKKYERAKI